MSFQWAIPWQVALRQSLPPLRRLETILNNPPCRTMIFQRTATTPLTSCLSPRVHSKLPPSPATPSPKPTRPNRRGHHFETGHFTCYKNRTSSFAKNSPCGPDPPGCHTSEHGGILSSQSTDPHVHPPTRHSRYRCSP